MVMVVVVVLLMVIAGMVTVGMVTVLEVVMLAMEVTVNVAHVCPVLRCHWMSISSSAFFIVALHWRGYSFPEREAPLIASVTSAAWESRVEIFIY